MIELHWLREHMQHCPTLAAWLHAQFDYEFASQSLADWQQEFAAGQLNGDWPALVALDGERLLGGAALARDDLPERPELGRWLACVYVQPQVRGQGLAERLIEAIMVEARRQGYQRIYLHTHDRRDYYARRGWQVMEQFQAWRGDNWLMQRELF